MNLENFHTYIDNPSLLYQIPYQELKGLVLQYPFAANLRYLLWLKSHLEENREEGANLSMAAALAPDRRKLRQLRQSFETVKADLAAMGTNDDFLELKDLGAMETTSRNTSETLRKQAAMAREDASSSLTDSEERNDTGDTSDRSASVSTSGDGLVLDDAPGRKDYGGKASLEVIIGNPSAASAVGSDGTAPDQEPGHTEQEVLQEAHQPPSRLSTDAHDAQDPTSPAETALQRDAEPGHVLTPDLLGEGLPPSVEFIGNPATTAAPQPSMPSPLPKGAFRSWQSNLEAPAKSLLLQAGRPSVLYKPITPQSAKPPQEAAAADSEAQDQQARLLAKKSVQQDVGIVSETLAALLERQQHFDKAILMYRKLMQQNPERGDFFSSKIAALKSRR
ncbi:MAG: hypothetical protein RLY31_2016 [Bacteroidota bacterium]|jgi:hypothetical protein